MKKILVKSTTTTILEALNLLKNLKILERMDANMQVNFMEITIETFLTKNKNRQVNEH